MKSKKNLVLLGMMGSGKNTIGLLISKKLKLEFVEIDKIIEKNANMKINDIFKMKGESYFRYLEEKTTLKSLNSKNTIISLGGGAFINDKIRNETLANNFSFWLNCDILTILNRLKKSKKRPLARKLNDLEIIKLFESRSKIYSKAKFKINCDKLSKIEIVNKIITLYENK